MIAWHWIARCLVGDCVRAKFDLGAQRFDEGLIWSNKDGLEVQQFARYCRKHGYPCTISVGRTFGIVPPLQDGRSSKYFDGYKTEFGVDMLARDAHWHIALSKPTTTIMVARHRREDEFVIQHYLKPSFKSFMKTNTVFGDSSSVSLVGAEFVYRKCFDDDGRLFPAVYGWLILKNDGSEYRFRFICADDMAKKK